MVQPLPGIGDLIWHLPHLAALASDAPEGLVLLAKPRAQARRILDPLPYVREVIDLERGPGRHDGFVGLRRLGRDLRAVGAKDGWVLHNSARYATALVLAGVPARYGYGGGMARAIGGLNRGRPVPPALRNAHPIEKAAAFMAANGRPIRDRRPNYDPPEAWRAAFRTLTTQDDRAWVALGLGASEPFKQWGSKRFAALADKMVEIWNVRVAALGGPDEATLFQEMRACMSRADAMTSVVGHPLETAIGAAAEARFYIGNDTGLLNVAAASGTPSIGLFGGSPPLGHDDRIKAVTPKRGVVYRDDRMAEITVEMAFDAAAGLRERMLA